MKKEFYVGRLGEASENEDAVIAVNDEEVENHFVLSITDKRGDFSFIAEKTKVRDFLKAILDDSE